MRAVSELTSTTTPNHAPPSNRTPTILVTCGVFAEQLSGSNVLMPQINDYERAAGFFLSIILLEILRPDVPEAEELLVQDGPCCFRTVRTACSPRKCKTILIGFVGRSNHPHRFLIVVGNRSNRGRREGRLMDVRVR